MIFNTIIWDFDPNIFWITDSFPLKYYGLFFATGLLLGFVIVKKVYLFENVPVKNLDKLTIYIVVGTILGARLGHCLFYDPTYYFQQPIEILLPIAEVNDQYKFIGFQGLASHGGAIGVLIAITLYCKKHNTKLLWVLDRISLAIPVTAAFIRLGNFMNSEIYGKPTNQNWGVIFLRDDLIARHPTQLYESFSYLLVSILMIILYKKGKSQLQGVIFGSFLILVFSARFVIEFFKENQVAFENNLPINMGQIMSLPFVLIGAFLIFYRFNNVKKTRPI